jgi:CheY-like chemotaxis protein
MPGMSGLDLLKQVRSNPALARLPFILVTAETSARKWRLPSRPRSAIFCSNRSGQMNWNGAYRLR